MYRYPAATEEIKQGDIFFDLPLIDFVKFEQLNIVSDDAMVSKTWEEVKDQENIEAAFKLKKVKGIVISQDCDNLRADKIVFALIDTLEVISPGRRIPPNQTTRDNQKKLREIIWNAPILAGYKWFYLREDTRIPFPDKMAADFEVIFEVPRGDLERTRASLRRGRLSLHALEHFQKSLANFFTRYAYSNWYPFTETELQHYNEVLEEGEKVEPIE